MHPLRREAELAIDVDELAVVVAKNRSLGGDREKKACRSGERFDVTRETVAPKLLQSRDQFPFTAGAAQKRSPCRLRVLYSRKLQISSPSERRHCRGLPRLTRGKPQPRF